MNDAWSRSQGTLLIFPDPASRPPRPVLSANEPRGEILLFTGVRYERPSPNPGPSRPFASDSTRRRS
ncbi:hypothetical protein [Microvirga puerhi]|uniref:Uncharacterized protein n=1 Tax=Microvirga puerhi TaxID=2876078 RepID=A0ABS7VLI0_9HYPH|nr:hypothetical protein [Microvirga puerhi]MBZ6076376.1 hypothetical protein [Microvirga puerhi]